MKKAMLSVVAWLALTSFPSVMHAGPRILGFSHMDGVDGPFLVPANAIRGIVGDEDPWVIARAEGKLDTKGHLKIQVRGLVFAPGVPNVGGTNDEADFRAVVSCLTAVSTTEVGTVNVFTAGFPATVTGDSDIDAIITLPNPCVAPIVFVIAGSEDKWFAVTGFESEAQ
jgi:hypothetical protein